MVDITGNIYNAIYLNQCIYWYGKMEGEFYKVEADWEVETTLSAKQQRTCRKHLIDLGFISVDRRGIPAKLHYTTHEGRILAALSQGTTSPTDMVEVDGKDSEDSTCTKGRTNTETTQRLVSTNVDTCQIADSEKKNGKNILIPYKGIFDLYNDICPPVLPSVRKLNELHRSQIKKIWDYDKEMRDIKLWENYFKYVMKSDWLTGKTKKWKASLRWITNYTNFLKIDEGEYHQ